MWFICEIKHGNNPSFSLIFDIRALLRSALSARMSEIKNGGLDLDGTKPFEQQQFVTSGIKGVDMP